MCARYLLITSFKQNTRQEDNDDEIADSSQNPTPRAAKTSASASDAVPLTRLSALGESDLARVRVLLRPRYRLTKRYDRWVGGNVGMCLAVCVCTLLFRVLIADASFIRCVKGTT